jgi:alpha-1,3-glucosyltransferase
MQQWKRYRQCLFLCREFIVASTVVTYSVLPLLHRPQDYPFKMLIAVTGLLVSLAMLQSSQGVRHGHTDQPPGNVQDAVGRPSAEGRTAGAPRLTHQAWLRDWGLSRCQLLYLVGFVPLELYCSFAHAHLLRQRLPFLPLMLTSVYCAAAIVALWGAMFAEFWRLAWQRGPACKRKSG